MSGSTHQKDAWSWVREVQKQELHLPPSPVDGAAPSEKQQNNGGLLKLLSYAIERSRATIFDDFSKSNEEIHQNFEKLHDQSFEVQESEEHYRYLAESFGDLMLHRRKDSTIIFANEKFLQTFGLSTGDIGQKRFDPLFAEDHAVEGFEQSSKLREVKVETEHGVQWFVWVDTDFRDPSNGEIAIRSIARDITRQKLIELELRDSNARAEESSHAKSRFLANVSHEMRTPLNGILGMSGLLADTQLTAEQQTYIDAIHDSGTALLTLIEDILDTSLVEANRLELRTQEVNPGQLIEDICELLASRAHTKGISISSFISNDIPSAITTDGGRLRQILINLVGNAIKFTECGGVKIRLTRSENDHGSLQFEVIDTGAGITPADQEKIFREFEQADNESTRKHGGAGLGLSISKKIVEVMGGTFGVESEPNKGSTFHFSIPIIAPENTSNTSDLVQLQEKRVTLVGFDHSTSATIREYIEYGGSECLVFSDFRDFPRVLDQTGLGITIINYGCLSQIAKRSELLSAIKTIARKTIIVLRPNQRAKLTEMKKIGCDGYLITPIRRASLFKMINEDSAWKKNEADSAPTKHENAKTRTKVGQPKRVLVAEDNDINALLVRSLLEKSGHTVTRAVNGEEAISIWSERRDSEPFDLILMDMQMPVLDGLDAIASIRTKNDDIPIFVLTADEQEETLEKSLSAGANGLLTKPLDPKKLLELVASTNCHKVSA